MESNKFEITGKVTFVDIKYTEKGSVITRALMSKKNTQKENEYDTYAFTFFGVAAEKFAEAIKKGDFVNITGRIGINKFKSKDGKDVEKYELYGNEFVKVKYDNNAKKYVPDTLNADSDEVVPW